MAAALPAPAPAPNGHDPALEQSGEKISIMDEVRQTLRRVRERGATTRLNEDSRLFKFKQKLTRMGDANDVARREAMIAEHEETEETEEAAVSSSLAVIPDPTPDPS